MSTALIEHPYLVPPSDASLGRPTHDADPYPRRWRIFAVLILSLVIISLDNTILNVALPDIQRALNSSSASLQWIVDGYSLTFAALLLLAGNLGDRYGRKGALQFGLLTFAVGSTAAVFADSTPTLLLARIVMGLGGAFVMPATLSVITNVFTGAERTKAIAIWTACAGIGVALGPLLGGWLLEHYWWGSVFVINIPVVAVAVVAGAFLIPESSDPHAGRADKTGALLASLACAAIVYGVIAAPVHGWTSTRVVGSLLIGCASLTVFIAVERRSENPILPMWFFQNRSFATASVCIMLVFFALYGSLYLLTQYLQVVRDYSALAAGVRTSAVALGIGAAAPLGPVFAERFGNRRVVVVGMSVTACGLSVFTVLGETTNYLVAAVALIVTGLGMGATMAPATDSIIGSVPAHKGGIGSAVNDMARQLGGAFGVAVLGSALSARYATHVTEHLHRVPGGSSAQRAITSSVGAAHAVADRMPAAAALRIRDAADSAYISAMHLAVLIAVGILLLGAAVAAVFLPDAPIVAIDPGSGSISKRGRTPRRGAAKDVGRHRLNRSTRGASRHLSRTRTTTSAAERRRNKRVIRRVLLEVVSERRLEVIEDLYRPDVLDHDPFPGAPPGIAGVRYSITEMHERVGAYEVRILDVAALDDLVITRCAFVPPGGSAGRGVRGRDARRTPVIVIWRLVDGQVAERWSLLRPGKRARRGDRGARPSL